MSSSGEDVNLTDGLQPARSSDQPKYIALDGKVRDIDLGDAISTGLMPKVYSSNSSIFLVYRRKSFISIRLARHACVRNLPERTEWQGLSIGYKACAVCEVVAMLANNPQNVAAVYDCYLTA